MPQKFTEFPLDSAGSLPMEIGELFQQDVFFAHDGSALYMDRRRDGFKRPGGLRFPTVFRCFQFSAGNEHFSFSPRGLFF
jgi:hypothetical protein